MDAVTQALFQLAAVVVGGLLTIAGGFFSTLLLETRKERAESRNLALALKGEISALVDLIQTRGYLNRLQQIADQIEASGKPFYMPFRIRYEYDRVYRSNLENLGRLQGPLPELIPRFYTQLASLMEDMVGLGEGTYAHLELPLLLRIYQDSHRVLGDTLALASQILREIDLRYPQAR